MQLSKALILSELSSPNNSIHKMGCASSKRIEATALDVYRPAPASFAVFNINTIEEPWLKGKTADGEDDQPEVGEEEGKEKPTHFPSPILEKLNTLDSEAPHSWDEVSKALEDLKPTINQPPKPAPSPTKPSAKSQELASPPMKKTPRKSFSFHTLDELESRNKPAPKPTSDLRKTESMKADSRKNTETRFGSATNSESNPPPPASGFRSVKESIFIQKDRLEREKEGKMAVIDKLIASKRDPLGGFPEKCPPGGGELVVIYTTSLHGVRKTYEDCNRARTVLEAHRVVFDERDVSLHGEFRSELKQLLGEEESSVPRVFIKGRYIGGVEELVEINETGRLARILSWARVEKGAGRQACEGCGGARFVPCLDCGGSCKVVASNGDKERCGKCNENGLVHCPLCLHL